MTGQIEKTTIQIRDRIEFWFLKYYGDPIEKFTGKEQFTLVRLISVKEQLDLNEIIGCRKGEVPVLLLKVTDESFIVNTTERFLNYNHGRIESLEYIDFDGHDGYDQIFVNNGSRKISVKKMGYTCDFVLKRKDGTKFMWNIPTGWDGFGFWNVTKKCELIGRKFLNIDKIDSMK